MSRIIGAFEKVKILKIGAREIPAAGEILAKIDTGAFSGVIHAENIQENGEILSFDLLGEKNLHFETRDFRRRIVRNTHGGEKRRYLVKFQVELAGEDFEILLGLDDRSKMKFEMLIGRAFLIKNGILVDSKKSADDDKEWKKMGGKQ